MAARFVGMALVAGFVVLVMAQAQSGCADVDDPWFPLDSSYDRTWDTSDATDTVRDDGTVTPDDAARDDGTVTPDDAARDDGTVDLGTCPETPCRLLPDCGCPSGQKCSLDFAELSLGNVVKLCRDAGTRDASQMCTADTECRSETVCGGLISSDPSSEDAMCYDYCNTDSDCNPTAGSICVQLSDAPRPGTCSHACNLQTSSGCPSGTACRPFSLTATGRSLVDCGADVGSGSPGSFCVDNTYCRAGTMCDTGVSQCLQYCSNVDGMCSGGLGTCYGFTEPLVIGGTEWGVCYNG